MSRRVALLSLLLALSIARAQTPTQTPPPQTPPHPPPTHNPPTSTPPLSYSAPASRSRIRPVCPLASQQRQTRRVPGRAVPQERASAPFDQERGRATQRLRKPSWKTGL